MNSSNLWKICLSRKDNIGSSAFFPSLFFNLTLHVWAYKWFLKEQDYLCIFFFSIRMSKLLFLNQNEQVILSEESSCQPSPSATSHPDPRDAYRILQKAKLLSESKKIYRTVGVSVVRKTSKVFTNHPTLPVVGNIHKVSKEWRRN